VRFLNEAHATIKEIKMQTLKDLIPTPQGRHFLEKNGITTNLETFVAQMEAPKNPVLQQYLGWDIHLPVYAFQQIYVDITQSMLDRIFLLDELTRFEGVSPFFLWIDTDRAGSDKITTRMYWPHWGKVQSIPICSGSVKDIETRFVAVDPQRLDAASEKLEMYLVQSVDKDAARAVALDKYEPLKDLFAHNHANTLSEFNLRVSYFLLNAYARLDPVLVLVSDLVNGGLLTAAIEAALHQIDGIIQTFNEARENLIQQNINPVVKALTDDYLPLNYSCTACRRRLRLHRKIEGRDQFAAATCRCGEVYRFYLGNRTFSLDELAQTGRWSPDVSLALFMNNLVSGFIGGGSSGVYFGLLMKAALEQVLQVRRVPVLLPKIGADDRVDRSGRFDSLIYRYLTETEIQVPMLEMSV
jgi:hypothetical protein